MNVLVTGADGFVGARLVPRLAAAGHVVTAAIRPGGAAPPTGTNRTVELELRDAASVAGCAAAARDAVVHLAGVASGADARHDPGGAWEVNAAGTARLCETLADRFSGQSGPLVLVVSTAEVYGRAEVERPRVETDAARPRSAYAASKLGAEEAALAAWRRAGLRVVVVRPFPHTGAGQDERFVVPAFARRLAAAKRSGAPTVGVGNLDVVRDLLHVDDVIDAYLALLQAAQPGETYNVASGTGISIREVFERLARLLGVAARPEIDVALQRPADIPHLVGDASRCRDRTGWAPTRTLDDALAEVVHAQAN